MRQFQIHRTHRILLFCGTIVWFIALVLLQRRNYQDSWILEDVLWPLVGFGAVYLWMIAAEDDNRIITIMTACAACLFGLVPAIKYAQPYGNSIDASDHYVLANHIVETGRVAYGHTYASIPGMHSWIASFALIGDLTAADAIKFGLPLTAFFVPLLVYWLCQQVGIAEEITKYMVCTTCLVIFPRFTPNGTTFSLVPLFTLLSASIIGAYYLKPGAKRKAFAVVALIALVQLIYWHSTTPMMVPLVLLSASLTPMAVKLCRIGTGNTHFMYSYDTVEYPITKYTGLDSVNRFVNTRFVILAIMAAVLFVSYHLIEKDRVGQVLLSNFQQQATTDAVKENVADVVPKRIFEISKVDLFVIVLLTHGRDLVMIGLMGIGILVVWAYRRQWDAHLAFYVFLIMVCVPFAASTLKGGGGAGYERFLRVPLVISMFFAGIALWWIRIRFLAKWVPIRWLASMLWLSILGFIFVIWFVQFFQPQFLVPKADAIATETTDEYLLWLHETNSAYQERMLRFVQNNTDPETAFAIDIVGARQFLRYFGRHAAYQRKLYLPLHRDVPFDRKKMEFMLLHWPGPAGSLGEPVENRSVDKLMELRSTQGWGLVYDNGESFILQIGSSAPLEVSEVAVRK